jgi:hypothetical protein
MLTVHTIQPGDIYYEVFRDNITRYEYLCIFPSKNPIYMTPENYHIVINKTSDKPERIYHKNLNDILTRNIRTYDEAKAVVKKYYEDRIKKFEEEF